MGGDPCEPHPLTPLRFVVEGRTVLREGDDIYLTPQPPLRIQRGGVAQSPEFTANLLDMFDGKPLSESEVSRFGSTTELALESAQSTTHAVNDQHLAGAVG